ncbi:hypothetical protein ACVTOK_003269 [Vibrio alginolyticus]
MAKHFPVVRAYKHKPTKDDFPTLPSLDLCNAEEDIRFPYLNWLSELMEEREHSGMPRFRLNQIADYLHKFLRFVDDNHSSSNERLYIQTRDIRQYHKELGQSNLATKSKNSVLMPYTFTFAG